ncbi:MAG: hypothetical protein A2Y24_07175 [Clostridiales bacterium GWE2_32_10]|nr:MAG: hypothetical protein A2Y24_07175 [Clostridiales bacterium GWE2_32_10]
MAEEYIELVDGNKQKTGVVIPRSNYKELLPEGQRVLIAALLVKNSEDKIMMQLTSKEKGSILSLPSGWVMQGDSSRETVVREMYEEQGLKIDIDKIILVEERPTSKTAFFDIYYLEADFKREDMVLQKEEVDDVIWMSPEEIFSAYDEEKVRKSSVESIRNFLDNKKKISFKCV